MCILTYNPFFGLLTKGQVFIPHMIYMWFILYIFLCHVIVHALYCEAWTGLLYPFMCSGMFLAFPTSHASKLCLAVQAPLLAYHQDQESLA